jgi:hypothetical protein
MATIGSVSQRYHVSDAFFGGLLLTECDDDAGVFDVIEIHDLNSLDDSKVVRFVLCGSVPHETCLTIITPVTNNEGSYGPRVGSQATLGDYQSSSVSTQR